MSSIGIMDGAFFVGRKEVVDWINSTLDLNIGKIEDTASGAVACQLLDIMHPNVVPMHKVNWAAKQNFEFIANYKLLQTSFSKLNIDKYIDVDRLISGRYMDNLEFMQWFKRFYEMSVNDKGDYDTVGQRCKGKGGSSYPFASKAAKTSTTTTTAATAKRPASSPTKAASTKPAGGTSAAPASGSSSRRPSNSSASGPGAPTTAITTTTTTAATTTTAPAASKSNPAATSAAPKVTSKSTISKPSKASSAKPAPSSGATASASASALPAVPIAAAVAVAAATVARSAETAALETEVEQLRLANDDQNKAFAELRLEMDGLEKERDFYFDKLRDIEILLQELEDNGQGNETTARIFKILYATAEGFEPIDETTAAGLIEHEGEVTDDGEDGSAGGGGSKGEKRPSRISAANVSSNGHPPETHDDETF